MKILRLLFALATLLGVAAPADAGLLGTRRVLLSAADRCVSDVGSTLRQLATVVNAAPSTNVTLAGNCVDRKPYSFPPITATYTGTFDGKGHSIFYRLTNTDNCTTLPSACLGTVQPLGLFGFIGTAGIVKNLTITGTVFQTGTMLDNSFMTWRVGILAGYLAGLIDNVNVLGSVTASGYYNYNCGIACDLQGGTISNSTVNVNLYQTVFSGTPVSGLISSFVRTAGTGNTGTVSNVTVTGGSNIFQSGVTPGATQSCSQPTPPATCPVTSGYIAAGIGAVGFQNNDFGQADHITINPGVTVTGAIDTTVLIGDSGGVISIIYYGTVTDVINYADITGTNTVGGCAARLNNGGPATPSAIPSQLKRCSNYGKITATVNGAGGNVGSNAGLVDTVANYGTVNCGTLGTACGGNIGLHRNVTAGEFAQLVHAFNWGMSEAHDAVGGNVGQTGTTDTVDQVYSVPSAYQYVNNGGGSVGVDNNDAGYTHAYWNQGVSGNAQGAGNNLSPADITSKTTAQFLAAMPAGFDLAFWVQDSNAGGWPHLIGIDVPAAPTFTSPTVVLLATTGSNNWTVTAPCDSGKNVIEAVGESGSAGLPSASTSARGPGGGAYASIRSLAMALGASIAYTNGTGGSSTKTQFKDASTLVADFGTNSTTAATGAGGATANSTGSLRHAGGAGAVNSGSNCGGAGGGAAGPNGNGKNAGGAATSGGTCGGGGGGAAENGSVGGTAPGTAGGNGGADQFSNAGGAGSSSVLAAGGNGVVQSGAGGGFSNGSACSAGGVGGPGTWPGGKGPGGGGGGGGGNATIGCSGGLGGGYGGAPGGSGRGGAVVGGTQGATQLTCFISL